MRIIFVSTQFDCIGLGLHRKNKEHIRSIYDETNGKENMRQQRRARADVGRRESRILQNLEGARLSCEEREIERETERERGWSYVVTTNGIRKSSKTEIQEYETLPAHCIKKMQKCCDFRNGDRREEDLSHCGTKDPSRHIAGTPFPWRRPRIWRKCETP